MQISYISRTSISEAEPPISLSEEPATVKEFRVYQLIDLTPSCIGSEQFNYQQRPRYVPYPKKSSIKIPKNPKKSQKIVKHR